MRVYLDSCVVIYRTEGDAALQDRINARLLNKTGAPPCVVFTDLTRLECRTRPLAMGDALILADYDDFFATPGYLGQPMDAAVFDRATELRAGHRLKTPDALHLAAGCGEFWTNDARLAQAAAPYLRLLALDSL